MVDDDWNIKDRVFKFKNLIKLVAIDEATLEVSNNDLIFLQRIADYYGKELDLKKIRKGILDDIIKKEKEIIEKYFDSKNPGNLHLAEIETIINKWFGVEKNEI